MLRFLAWVGCRRLALWEDVLAAWPGRCYFYEAKCSSEEEVACPLKTLRTRLHAIRVADHETEKSSGEVGAWKWATEVKVCACSRESE